ncbi:MAG: SDR family NAD(P)-dependent oxidoreductase [Bacteroidetes bacterium]|nr:MAG: SDR family NAD(P)-dependent oxidoreductase [Bacteroidota bacterium]
MSKTALVTGATAGIGLAIAKMLADEGYRLIISGRRVDRLNELAKELKVETYVMPLDVRNREGVSQAIAELPENWQKIDVLVNNAGLAAGLASFEDGNLDHWDQMVDTNVKGLLYVTKAVAPLMIEHKTGHIINISSIAGKEVYALGNVYCATKHAVDALNRGMRIDLAKYPIKVSGINPGAVETEFSIVRFDGDAERAKKVYEGFENLVAEDIAEAARFILNRPPHVNINDLTIMPTAQPSVGIIHRKS